MEQRAIPVIVLSGFLGSGKTTLLLRLLQQAKSSGLRASVLMNEIGAVDVDGTLVDSESAYQLMERITEGCLCCSKKSELSQCLERLALMRPDVIVMELTGVANPEEIVEAMTEPSIIGKVALHRIVTVIDAEHALDYNSIFSSDRELIRTLRRQIEVADIIVANKADLISDRTADKVKKLIEDRNESAQFISAVRCELDASAILDGIAAAAGRRQPAIPGTRPAGAGVRPASGTAGDAASGMARATAGGATSGAPAARDDGARVAAGSAAAARPTVRLHAGAGSGSASSGAARSGNGDAAQAVGAAAAGSRAAASGTVAASGSAAASGRATTTSGSATANGRPMSDLAAASGSAAASSRATTANGSAATSGGIAAAAGHGLAANPAAAEKSGSFSRIRTTAIYPEPSDGITRRQFEAFVSGRGNGCLRAKGYMPFGKDGAHLLFQLAGKRIEWSPSTYDGAPYFVMIGIDLDEAKIKQEWARLARK